MKVCKKMCATCPFREGSKYEQLAPELTMLSLRTARICHSTGSKPNAIYEKPPVKEAMICRGSRDFQLRYFHSIGFLKEPTDQAWIEKCAELGIKPDTHKDDDDD